MRDYSEDLSFKSIDSSGGNYGLLDSTLALVNNSGLPDEEVRKEVSGFLEKVTIDFHSEGTRELSALYETENGRNSCSIYDPREGEIKSVESNHTEVEYTGRKNSWERFIYEDTNYSVLLR